MKHLDYQEHITFCAGILILIGLILRYWIGNRRFNRRGVAGMQYYKSYNVALITIIIEKLVNVIAVIMIIGGMILYLIK